MIDAESGDRGDYLANASLLKGLKQETGHHYNRLLKGGW